MSTSMDSVKPNMTPSIGWLHRHFEGVFDWRNRLLMSRQFQRWAGRFPLTRRVSKAKAAEVFDLVAGFVYSQVLFACVQARLFELLATGPQSKQWISEKIQLDEAATEVLLDAAIALRLIEPRSSNRYALGMLGAPLVGNQPVLSMIEHHRALYLDLKDPLALLKNRNFDTALAKYWPYTSVENSGDGRQLELNKKSSVQTNPSNNESVDTGDSLKEQVAVYSGLMAASQPFVADEVLNSVSFVESKRVLDVGGGEGEFLLRLARHSPHLQLTLFDLPAVALRAQQRFASAGIGDRSSTVGGSFLSDSLPEGHDTITLLRVMHDHDDPQVILVLRAIRKALAPGGRLIVAEPMAQTPGAERMGHAYFGFYLWAMGRGRSRSASRLTQLLNAAGFANVQELPSHIPLQARLLSAQ
jgi:demethylspheroidene O-methyltransferase